MGRFRIQILLEDITCSTRYKLTKNDRYCISSTDWTLITLNFNEENFGIKLLYDQINTLLVDVCFSSITITQFIFKMNHV